MSSLTTNSTTSSPTSSRPSSRCSSEHIFDDEGTQIHPRSLRERRGWTLSVHIEPPKYKGPPAGKPEPLVVNPNHSYSYSSGQVHASGGLTLQNLPRRRRPSAAPQPGSGR
ncbi:hypothetical protein H0H92_012533 [Tricholoma furcatifolium]|nr:hypothetical protein H0H92_012533 [Tricholoma furcatifolium]